MSWPNTPCQAAINSTAAFIVPLQSVWTVAEPDGYDGTGQSHLQDHGVHLISSMFLRRFLYQAWQRRRFDSNSRHHGSQKSNIAIRADPRLLGTLRKTVSTGGGGGLEELWMKHICPSWIALEKQCLFRGSLCFQLVVLVSTRDFIIFTLHDLTDFYIEHATAPHYDKWSFMFS